MFFTSVGALLAPRVVFFFFSFFLSFSCLSLVPLLVGVCVAGSRLCRVDPVVKRTLGIMERWFAVFEIAHAISFGYFYSATGSNSLLGPGPTLAKTTSSPTAKKCNKGTRSCFLLTPPYSLLSLPRCSYVLILKDGFLYTVNFYRQCPRSLFSRRPPRQQAICQAAYPTPKKEKYM